MKLNNQLPSIIEENHESSSKNVSIKRRMFSNSSNDNLLKGSKDSLYYMNAIGSKQKHLSSNHVNNFFFDYSNELEPKSPSKVRKSASGPQARAHPKKTSKKNIMKFPNGPERSRSVIIIEKVISNFGHDRRNNLVQKVFEMQRRNQSQAFLKHDQLLKNYTSSSESEESDKDISAIQDRIKELQNKRKKRENKFENLLQTYRPNRDKKKIQIVSQLVDDSKLFTNSESSIEVVNSQADQKTPAKSRARDKVNQ